MSSAGPSVEDDRGLPAALVTALERACDRFEAACRAGLRPRIEDYLGEMPDAGRVALARELRALEGAYRARGELATAGRPAEMPGPGPAPPASSRPEVAGYEILGELGRGSMGVVYRARQRSLNRPVALKMILAGAYAGPAALARFRNEAEAAARLQHPNIVPIYELGEHIGMPYAVLELVAGGSLDRRLAGGPLPARGAAELIEALARAIDHAHRRGVVHRDLKPSNILLMADGTPKISDFGLAKLVSGDGGLTQTGEMLGTPSYMAPEQAENRRDLGPAVDIWALGAILYECLTGRRPFCGRSVLETLELIRSGTPPRPGVLCEAVPPALEVICLRCLEKDPAARYPSAAALADDLRRSLGGAPTDARPTAPRPDGRARALRGGLIAAAILVVVALGALMPLPGRWWADPGPREGPALAGSIDIVVYESATAGTDSFQPGDSARQGLHLQDRRALPLGPRDWIRIEATVNRPAYLYLVWIDTDGRATPLWPWRSGAWTDRPAPEQPRVRLNIPDPESGKDIMPLDLGSPGVEALILLGRDAPLSPDENQTVRQAMTLRSARWATVPAAAELDVAVWLENGERVSDESTRAPIPDKAASSGDPEIRIRELMGGLRDIFPYTRAVCFGNRGRQE
jgi:hypothetical protein